MKKPMTMMTMTMICTEMMVMPQLLKNQKLGLLPRNMYSKLMTPF